MPQEEGNSKRKESGIVLVSLDGSKLMGQLRTALARWSQETAYNDGRGMVAGPLAKCQTISSFEAGPTSTTPGVIEMATPVGIAACVRDFGTTDTDGWGYSLWGKLNRGVLARNPNGRTKRRLVGQLN